MSAIFLLLLGISVAATSQITGTRAVVIVRKESGAFEPRSVRLGADLGDTVEVTQGLNEGEHVVASGQFLIDSEASLRSVIGNMAASPEAPVGQGKVERTERRVGGAK